MASCSVATRIRVDLRWERPSSLLLSGYSSVPVDPVALARQHEPGAAREDLAQLIEIVYSRITPSV